MEKKLVATRGLLTAVLDNARGFYTTLLWRIVTRYCLTDTVSENIETVAHPDRPTVRVFRGERHGPSAHACLSAMLTCTSNLG